MAGLTGPRHKQLCGERSSGSWGGWAVFCLPLWCCAPPGPHPRAPQRWPCLCPASLPSAHGALTQFVPPCWGSACHGGTQGWLEPVQAWECGGSHLSSCCQQRPGTQGEERRREEGEPALGEGEIGCKEREETTFSRKKSLQFPPCIPLCKRLGRGLSTGPASPSASPQLLIPGGRGSGKARGTDSFSKTPLTSLSPQHILPCHRLGGRKMCKNMQIPRQELCKPCGRERGIWLDTPRFHTQT